MTSRFLRCLGGEELVVDFEVNVAPTGQLASGTVVVAGLQHNEAKRCTKGAF